ncbi:MAG: hypothetical protein IJM61_04590 [Firmicutes bacterium]|nr:hypothetical protein [Bacillota bacterium]
MNRQKKDYSEFEHTEYDRYRSIRSNRNNLQLDYFRNNVLFENKGRFTIDIDPFHEFYAMYDELVDYEKECAEREGRAPYKVSMFEDGDLGNDARQELIEYNSQIVEIFKDRLGSADSEEQEITGMQAGASPDMEMDEEPLNNVFSGTNVTLNLGEGILDFVYADFITPSADCLSLYSYWEKLKERSEKNGAQVDRILADFYLTEPEPENNKVYNHLQLSVETYYDYCSTFDEIKDIAYASLYSAIFPPVFTDIKIYSKKQIQQYFYYLMALQKEYLEILEFCFDEDYFPEVLGGYSPGERYVAYRYIHDLPTYIHRNEILRMDGNVDEHETHGGLDFAQYAKVVAKNINKDLSIFTDFAKKYSISESEARMIFVRPRHIYIDYEVRTVADMLELELSKMIEENIHFRKCKRCGRYFIVKGNYNTNYCNRIADGETRSCQELAAMETYKKKVADVPAMAIYQRYYKRYKARERVNQIKKDDFNKWKYKAMDKREDCINGKITPEQFEEWLEGCFPNRPKKDQPQAE